MIGFADFASSGRRSVRRSRLRAPLPPLSWTLAAAFLLLLVFGVRSLLAPQRFPVRSIRIEGDFAHVPKAAVLAAVEPAARGNFFRVPLGSIRAAVGSLPWVDQVSVLRAWPYKIVIHFTLQQPSARWAGGGWINSRGQPIRLGGRMLPAGLPVLSGPPDSVQRVYERFQQWSPLLARTGLQITALALSPRGGWRVRTTNGSLIVVGREQCTPRLKRFLRLLTVIQGTHPGQQMARIDLRYGNGFAVAWTTPAHAQGTAHD